MKHTIERLAARIHKDLDKIVMVDDDDTDCMAAAELVVHLRDAQVSINLALDQYIAMTTTPKEVC